MTVVDLVNLIPNLTVSGLLALAILGVLRGDWVPGRMYQQLRASFLALEQDHAKLRDEFDEYRAQHTYGYSPVVPKSS